MPARIHLTLPLSWQGRRLKGPTGLILAYVDIPPADRAWFGAVPVTKPARTVNDCAAANAPPDFIMQAIAEGLHRGLFRREEVATAEHSIAIYRSGR